MATSDAGSGLTVQHEGRLVRLTIDRPATRNALSLDLLLAMEQALATFAGDPEIGLVVLGAVGPVFSSGHDLKELRVADEGSARRLFEACARVMLGLRRLPQPVIARVQGHAAAAGCQLVAACDLVVSAVEATFSTPGVKIGLFCDTPMVPLVRSAQPRPSLEMLLTGRPITARRALEIGLVNRVVEWHELDAAVHDLAAALLSRSPAVLARGKAAFYRGLEQDEEAAYAEATEAMIANLVGPDAREGVSAFLDKRNPNWRAPRPAEGTPADEPA